MEVCEIKEKTTNSNVGLSLSKGDNSRLQHAFWPIPSLEAIKPIWRKQTIWESFQEVARRWPQNICITSGDSVCYTYEQVLNAVQAVVEVLRLSGLRQGDCVAVRCNSGIHFSLLSLVLYALGISKVVLSSSMGSYELAYKLKKTNAILLLEDSSLYDLSHTEICKNCSVVSIAWDVSQVDHCKKKLSQVNSDESTQIQSNKVSLDRSESNQCSANLSQIESDQIPYSLQQWISAMADAAQAIHLPSNRQTCSLGLLNRHASDEVADIFFTSGSTGNPKAVGLSHDMMLRSAWANCVNRRFHFGYRLCVPLPLSHVYGYIDGFLAVMQVGGTLITPSRKMKSYELLSLVQKTYAEDILLVPNLAIGMVEYLKDHPSTFSSLKTVYCSASSCPDWLWGAMKECFGVENVTTGYGMTEVCGASFQSRYGCSNEELSSSVGYLLQAGCAGVPELCNRTIEYKVINPETGQDVSAGEVGELCCRGVTVFPGYINSAEATEKAFDSDGWFHVGDLGYFDTSGCLTLVGRTSETYKINGENVSPRFVENLIKKCIVVKDVRIVGVPEDRYGEVGVAFVELDNDNISENQKIVYDFCRTELARYQVPKYYFFVDEDFWPRNETGKVLRPVLKKEAIRLLQKDTSTFRKVS